MDREDFKYQVMMDRVTIQNRYMAFIAGIQNPDLESKICIQIPSFCDEELLCTIKSYQENAANPDRLTFAVCFQDDDTKTLSVLQSMPNCKVKHIPADKAPGLCAARYFCSRMQTDETYVLHTDSHMRAARYWDVAMIHMWQKTKDEKAILSSYPLDYADYIEKDPCDEVFTSQVRDEGSFIGTVSNFNVEGTIRFKGYDRHREPETIRGMFISGGCVFARASLDKDCPSDPEMFFVADEGSLNLRYFTYGYHIYHPAYMPFWHWYGYRVKKDGTPVRRFNTGDQDYTNKRILEEQRIRSLFGLLKDSVDMGEFGLGGKRTREEFLSLSGIDFKNHACRGFAKKGRFFQEHSEEDMLWHYHIMSGEETTKVHVCQTLSLPEVAGESEKAICVQITGNEKNLLRAVFSLYYQAAHPKRVHVRICLPDNLKRMKEKLKQLTYLQGRDITFVFLPEYGYVNKAREACQALYHPEEYTLFTDTDSMAVKNWDTMLIRQLESLSDEKAVLSAQTPDLGPSRGRGLWRGSFDLPYAAKNEEELETIYESTTDFDVSVPADTACDTFLFTHGSFSKTMILPDKKEHLYPLLLHYGFSVHRFYNCYLLHDDKS